MAGHDTNEQFSVNQPCYDSDIHDIIAGASDPNQASIDYYGVPFDQLSHCSHEWPGTEDESAERDFFNAGGWSPVQQTMYGGGPMRSVVNKVKEKIGSYLGRATVRTELMDNVPGQFCPGHAAESIINNRILHLVRPSIIPWHPDSSIPFNYFQHQKDKYRQSRINSQKNKRRSDRRNDRMPIGETNPFGSNQRLMETDYMLPASQQPYPTGDSSDVW